MKREFARSVAILMGASACGSTNPSVPPPAGSGASSNAYDASTTGPSSGSSSGSPSGGPTSGSLGNAGASGGVSTPDDSGTVTGVVNSDGGTASTEGGAPSGAAVEPILPQVMGTCPMLTTGFVTIQGISVQVWAGTKQAEKKAPMVVYWHVTGGTSAEAVGGIGMPQAVADEITGAGGVIVSPQNTTGMGNNTGNDVWYTGDFPIADQLVACAFQQYNLDDHRIYTMGGSAGALQAGIMVFQRSNYIAASLPNSGGYTIGGDTFQNPMHIPSVMTMHGAQGVDVVIVDFSQQSLYLDGLVATAGGFAVDCDHGGGHVGAPDNLKTAGWQFLKDHPFGVSPEPYANGLPSTFPSYCKIITAKDAIPNPLGGIAPAGGGMTEGGTPGH